MRFVEGKVDKDGVNAAMKAAASDSFGYTEDEIVSSDIIGITYGSLFDGTQTKCMDMGDGSTLVKVVSWYDNENSYTSQMVRTIKYFAELKYLPDMLRRPAFAGGAPFSCFFGFFTDAAFCSVHAVDGQERKWYNTAKRDAAFRIFYVHR